MNCFSKKFVFIFIVIALLFVFASCSTYFSITYDVETGDSIKVQLDTTSGYELENTGSTFEIHKNGELVTKGIFLTEDMMAPYLELSEDTDEVTVFDKDASSVFYHSGNEWNYVFRIDDSNTGIALVNLNSKESAEECKKLLTITAET